MLFNRQDGLSQKVFTDEKGNFVFSGSASRYLFHPRDAGQFRAGHQEQHSGPAGMRSVLNVSLAALFSSIHLVYPAEHPAFMSDDWKWVLRTAGSTRPVMRLLPVHVPRWTDEDKPHRTVFSDTRGLLMFSAGDGAPVAGFGSSADMGTAFALATSLFGSNQFQFAGNVGSGAQSGIPSAAFRTTYSRTVGSDSPEVSVTMRELFLPEPDGRRHLRPGRRAFPCCAAFRSISTIMPDHRRALAAVWHGLGLGFLQRPFELLQPLRPADLFAWQAGEIEFAYTSGNARPDLAAPNGPDDPLQREIGTLALFPLVSLRAGRAEVQRGEDLEAGYSRTMGSRKFGVSAYHESVEQPGFDHRRAGWIPAGRRYPAGLLLGHRDVQRRQFFEHGLYRVGHAERGRQPERHGDVRFDRGLTADPRAIR
jgi:hypothetical protein